jgi:tetratricopeptide (TPR) repeat protein
MERLYTGYSADMKRARALLRQSRIEEGTRILEDLRARRPDDPTVIGELALAYRRADRVDEAIALLRETLLIKPDFDMAHFHLAGACLQKYQGQSAPDPELLETAMEEIETVLRLSPTFAAAHARRADILLSLGRHDDAIVSLREAMRFEPENPMWALRAGAVHVQQEQWESAIPVLETAVALDPDSVQATLMLVTAQLKLGRLDDARSLLQSAAERFPDDPRIRQVIRQIEEATAPAQEGE